MGVYIGVYRLAIENSSMNEDRAANTMTQADSNSEKACLLLRQIQTTTEFLMNKILVGRITHEMIDVIVVSFE